MTENLVVDAVFLKRNAVTFEQLHNWLADNVGPSTWSYNANYAESAKWKLSGINISSEKYWRIIITDYSVNVKAWYTELLLKWG